jgi:hypothetical protein
LKKKKKRSSKSLLKSKLPAPSSLKLFTCAHLHNSFPWVSKIAELDVDHNLLDTCTLIKNFLMRGILNQGTHNLAPISKEIADCHLTQSKLV